MTTDQVVAEYAPAHNSQDEYNQLPGCRKSEMVREWCDKTSLVMNKLYPTILGETFLIDDESAPWKAGDFTNATPESNSLFTNDLSNKSNDLNQSELNETKASYTTCLSKKLPQDNFYISGVKPLEQTAHECQGCTCTCTSSETQNKRYSVYQNFSLPGSPSSITHKNYNNKSSLRKRIDTASAKSDNVTPDKSLFTDDNSVRVDLDKVMALVQNRTNERLSSCKSDTSIPIGVKASNTRRSSASSGVSSNFSGGSIAVASVGEEYKYQDREEEVVLIEKRLLVSTVV